MRDWRNKPAVLHAEDTGNRPYLGSFGGDVQSNFHYNNVSPEPGNDTGTTVPWMDSSAYSGKIEAAFEETTPVCTH